MTHHESTTAAVGSRWIARHFFTPSGAVVAELRPDVTPEELLLRLAGRPYLLHLDSSLADAPATRPRLGRHSFIAADPIHSLVVPATDETAGPDAAGSGATGRGAARPSCGERLRGALDTVRSLLADLATPTIPGLPPFQGGVAGLVAYECGLALAGIPWPAAPEPSVPLLSFHVCDVVAGFDHDLGRGWIISQGLPARGPVARRARGRERLDGFLASLGERDAPPPSPARPVPHPDPAGLVSNRSPESHAALVARGIEYVRAGDVFQVNLARRLALAGAVDPLALHLACRGVNPAPFAGYFSAADVTIVSCSPERLLQVERGVVRMHPIKGTRRMLAQPEADLFAGADLGGSEKDRAENVMIVDLVRNDLSRVCLPDSVRVESLCRLERYQYVQHLVSVVAGRLRPGLTAVDALEAAIPGGSVTGAPKHRACEIIAELEEFGRGAYCGSLGWIGFDGNADFNLLIRTFTVGDTATTFAVGGGITARSDPAAEYAETLHKAEGMIRGLRAAAAGDGPPAHSGGAAP